MTQTPRLAILYFIRVMGSFISRLYIRVGTARGTRDFYLLYVSYANVFTDSLEV